ncbi:MOSC domain-containing protein [Streptantibioticus rubrisoli]|uniref:MOSC domain-containing protein n=1 Tax=Streptantibioticus rubrisoli TaxID=1387313 RepID=A0ABT1PAV0_9ACTN|nr:MOSC N-terminal beta barrel domain-containing protein [Streptantibioticus rubrisoli]MCQ4041911.1 MOSC domain-containing protein [Streptantibioticus rubrisoli]
MRTPHLSALHVYPVKSVGGLAPGEAAVEPWGLAGDRRWLLVDGTGRFLTQRQLPRLALVRAELLPGGGVRVSAPGMAPLDVAVPEPVGTTAVQIWRDKVEAVPAAAEAGAWFGAFLDAEVALVHLDDPARRRPIDPDYARPGETVSFADGYPLLLTSTASLDALNALIAEGRFPEEGPLPMDRFRPSVVVTGTEPWAEDGWRRVRIGEVAFRVVKPCARCVITTTDQRTAQRGREPLRTLAQHRRFGEKLVFGQNLIPEHPGTVRVDDPFTVLE